jgi:ataxia telangiectasia mutated family protein
MFTYSYTAQLWDPNNKPYTEWVCDLAYSLVKHAVMDEVMSLCDSLCKTKPKFAEVVFPFMVYNILSNDNDGSVTRLLSRCINTYVLSSTNKNDAATQLVLSTLNFIRKRHMQETDSGKRFWDLAFWKDISLLDVARAAKRCSAYFTSLLYVELWTEKEFRKVMEVVKCCV